MSERASVENAQIHSAASERAGFFQAYLQLADEQVGVELASERGTQNSCTRHQNLGNHAYIIYVCIMYTYLLVLLPRCRIGKGLVKDLSFNKTK